MNKPLSICVLRLSAIGDVCHTVAAIQAIQRQYPEYKITWIIGKTEFNLVKYIPNIEFILFDKKNKYKEIFHIWKQLRNRQFDFLLNMQTAFRASVLSLGIKAKYKVGFNKARSREAQFIFTNLKIKPISSLHVLDHQMMFAEVLGVKDLVPKWDLHIPKEEFEFSSQFIDNTKNNIIIAPCSSNIKRDWAVQNYIKIAQFLIDRNINVIICGSPSSYEIKTANIIQESVPDCKNITGQTSLTELASLISQTNLIISSDSGPAHIATTQGTPVLGLYAVQNPRRTGPYNNLKNVISVYDEAIFESYGKTWDNLPWATKAKGENLMEKITVKRVKQKLITFLKMDNAN